MKRIAVLPLLLLVACGNADTNVEASTPPAAAAATAAVPEATDAPAAPKTYTYEVVETFPHGTEDFTQGLFIADGTLYESTGKVGKSTLIRHDIIGDGAEKRVALPATIFGEGATVVDDRIITLTWRAGTAYVFDLDTLEQVGTFQYAGEGWGLTYDGSRLIMSDGTDTLRFFDPATFEETGRVQVKANGRPITRLNELEFIKGEVWANIWQTDVIVRLDPSDGHVTGFINLAGLHPDRADVNDEVLNGIAYDAAADKIYVTGKWWPKVFEIAVVPTGK
ncbi:glutaminyl-peptide cyclotransferase [Parvularcula sp. LCG005]|uniref:glutaminyl-peptide cyclotransferase n=1 Tax=Parvularcula sp. LCG005 TaxID=3078805 RepID=UPI0029421EE4|nr:glutaminyl-peptide cyclotransferase [Parvularcula sp. LCG005]WOI53655.1 glutaminyl-peptide cyclotransferase [Parvularcula sp. LCG005]